MTIPFWCLFAAILLPYVWHSVAVAQRITVLGHLDNKLPRAQAAQLTGLGARANGASMNAFENLPIFGISVIVAHLAGADAAWAAKLAVAWVICRVLHGVLYLLDIDKVRTVAFGLGLGCCIGLFVIAIQAAPK